MNSETKICQNCKKDFTIEPDDFTFYEKIKVPPPTFCFDCRLQRKLSFLNERTLFKRKCDKCFVSIISMYSPNGPHKVYCTDCYNNRNDCVEYGIDYDFFKPFFEQFYNIFKEVPRLHLAHKNNNAEGCEYSNYTYHCRNAYLTYSTVRSEDVYYSKQGFEGNKICLDSYNIKNSERGYELIEVSRIYNSRFLIRSSRCIDCAFLFDCSECNNCFMSYNLRNKSYVFRNEQLSREEYLKKMEDMSLDSYEAQERLKREFFEIKKKGLCRPAMFRNVENCTGDYIGHSKNTHYSFGNVDTEDSKYIVFGTNRIRSSYDILYSGKNEFCYEIVNAGSNNNSAKFALDLGTGVEVNYCISCNNCNNLFGCVGLKNKQFCILNKQYSEEEYKELIPKIIQHMNDVPYIDKKGRVYKYGEFFPIEISPFAYNESLAYEEFSFKKEEIINKGYLWHDSEEKLYLPTIESRELPDSINNVSTDIVSEIIRCPNDGKVETKCTFAYRIMPDELRFYKLMKIPLPRFCPNCRYYQRHKFKSPWKLWHRKCMKPDCTNEFETSYSPDRPEIVYCEKCYNGEVY